MSNMQVRSTARQWGVPLWEVAKRMGISERTMSRRLQAELPKEEAHRIIEIIREIVRERGDF